MFYLSFSVFVSVQGPCKVFEMLRICCYFERFSNTRCDPLRFHEEYQDTTVEGAPKSTEKGDSIWQHAPKLIKGPC